MSLIWIIAALIFSYHLRQNWDYPWFGNPDQDLVFLRDGLRIFHQQKPGYSDHPGFLQMLLGAATHVLAGDKATELLDDQAWQYSFRLHKALNAIAMASLITWCSWLIGRLTGRKWDAFLFGVLNATSIGTLTHIYQLRNEFLSAYLFYIGALVVAIAIKENNSCTTSQKKRELTLTACIYNASIILSLLAKAQSFPLLVLLNIGTIGWIRTEEQFSPRNILGVATKTALSALVTVAALGMAGMNFEGQWLPAFSLIILIQLPIIAAFSKPSNQSKNNPRPLQIIYTVNSIFIIIYGLIAQAYGWQHISWNPYSMISYRTSLGETSQSQVTKAISSYNFVFERTFDGQMVAHALAIVIAIYFATITVLSIANKRSKKEKPSQRTSANSLRMYLFVCALLMSIAASYRWPVDHYLPYQQPLLFLALITNSRKDSIKSIYLLLVTYMLISGLIGNLRYADTAFETYVKSPSSLKVGVEIPQSEESRYSKFLCASQHEGPEWSNSIVGKVCGY